jgi:dihydroorotase-like cyclic amidohydrolase
MLFPGLIDPHVHLRDPGQTEKEDFHTGTMAALAGGFTAILDMPNNLIPITTYELLMEKRAVAEKKIVCDVGFYFGSLGDNLDEFEKIKSYVIGLKVFLNKTTGNFTIDERVFEKICASWPKDLPILLHAEEDILDSIFYIGNKYQKRIHVCHVSSQKELQLVMDAKKNGQTVTCGVTPHHLFLTDKDAARLENFLQVKPSLKSKKDQNFLWKHFRDIDIVESDHAPHLKKEKINSNPLFGMPGLETTLPLLLTAMYEGRITKEDIIDKCFTKPKQIFSIPDQPDTYVEVDEKEEWTIKNGKLFTRSKWSPFDGWKVTGRVKQVILRGTKVFEDGKILVKSGFGKIL